MCLSRRVPLLLARGLVRLLVVDSVAALFRSEFEAADWLERTKQLLTFSSTLHHLSQEFTTPVLCINQVTQARTHTTVQVLLYLLFFGGDSEIGLLVQMPAADEDCELSVWCVFG